MPQPGACGNTEYVTSQQKSVAGFLLLRKPFSILRRFVPKLSQNREFLLITRRAIDGMAFGQETQKLHGT